MILVSAGRPPHTMFRSFAERDKAEIWAQLLLSKGVWQVTVNGQVLGSAESQGVNAAS